MKRMLVALAIVIAAFVALYFWMGGGGELAPGRKSIEPLTIGAPPPARTSTAINVVSWNVAWAYGWGSDYRPDAPTRTEADLSKNLERIAQTLVQLDADLVLVQEIDFGSDRSFGVDQAHRIAELAGLTYVAPAVSWDLRYLPFPYWPPSRHAGRVRSGGAILSRFPLSDCWVELLEKPASQPFWYRPFYLFRYLQGCSVTVGGRRVTVVNTHLEAFDPLNRQEQARVLADRVAKLEGPVVFGGDLNSVPPEAGLRRGFPDEPETDLTEDATISIVRAIPGLQSVVSTASVSEDPSRWYTFPSHAPNRTLDHLFVGSDLKVLSAKVHREAGEASDHLPVVARIALPD